MEIDRGAAGPSCQCEQGDVTFASRNGLRSVGNVLQRRGTANVSEVTMPHLEVQEVDH
ncbi:hypothetical protein ACVWWG_009210 [Bradyrhizobium sp. LB7.2]